MQIKVNGQLVELAEMLTITDFIKSKNLKPDSLVIQYNYKILKREEWSNTILKENDELEILNFVGGG
ncbi:MAG: sulfur carrier protein [Clostridia bacterium]|jgi:sulfur carrier protein|nr:sulfur carrier protein [Clostridia bacterium]MDN5322616.1 sulfur carrier protein [Clostridia bacterium]